MKKLFSVGIAALLFCTPVLALDTERLTQALADPARDAADQERDATRKPVEVLGFFGVEEGMTVLDIMASGGWYTEVLSHAVGPEGTVLMQNSPAALGMRGTEEAVTARLAGDRLPNVQRVDRDFSDLGIDPESVDFAITALNFHDLQNADPALAQNMLAAVKAALKPDGVLGLIDHQGSRGNDNTALHRIELGEVIKAVTEAGFLVAGMSDVLSVGSDDHSVGPFAPELGRNTDRIVLKLVKP